MKDQIIFVKDDINLNEADSKIYLRDESQLIQGDLTTGNSGIGELSLYQEGTVNQWTYNYWCSPIGGILSNTSINNSFRLNQTDDPLLSTMSTIDSQDSGFTNDFDGYNSPLTISNRWLWTYVASDSYSDWAFVGSTNDIAPGLGFTMKGIGTAATGNQTYDFRGKPNNGTIGNAVLEDLFTLVGNPYPSAIDAALYIHDTDNINAIDGTLYYWEQNGTVNSHVLQDYEGGYYEFTINAAGDIITDTPAVFMTYNENDNSFPLVIPANGVKTAGRYIPIGQGFMVKGETGTTGTVFAKNEHRVYEKEGSSSSFFRNASLTEDNNENASSINYQTNGLSLVPADYKRFRLNVDFSVNQSQYTRQLILNFHNTATEGYDKGLELKRSSNYATDTYFTIDNKVCSGAAYAFDEALVIPLNVDIEEQQPMRIRIFDIQNFEDGQGIYIHDNNNDTYVNLRNQNFEINIELGNYSNRFEIVFIPNQELSVEDVDLSSVSITQDNQIHQLVVSNPNSLEIKKIEVFDVIGKQVLSKSYNTSMSKYKLTTTNFSDGVYVVNVVTGSNTIKTQKVIVKN